MKEENHNNNERSKVNPDEENLINKNTSDLDSKREISDPHHSNVDPLKPQFERDNLQADREKRAGSGGSGRNPGNDDGQI